MNRDNDRQTSIILAVLGILPIVWLGLLIAPSVKGGLPEILPSLMNVMSDPFHIVLCEDSVKTVLVLLLCYGMGIGIYFSTRRNYRRREEHGSAKWGNAKAVDKKYRQNPPTENKLMTQAVRIGLNGKKHRRNLNTLVCGGSGAGKTRFYSLSVSALLKPVSVEREPQRIPVPARRSPFRQLRLRHLKQARLSRMPSISKPNYKAKGTAIEMIAVPFLNIYLLLHITEAQNIPSFTSKRQIPP